MEKYSIKISIDHPSVTLGLLREQKVVDEVSWEDRNSLSVELLAAIDKLLKKNKIKKEQLNSIDVESKQSTYSSTRIAKIIAKAGCYCLTNFSSCVE